MTRRTPGRTAGFDNRRSTRSPFAYLSNTPITGQDRQYRHTGRNTPTALVIITKCGAEPGEWPEILGAIWHDVHEPEALARSLSLRGRLQGCSGPCHQGQGN